MRRASNKIEIAFYEGMRIGISNAINAYLQQNGMTPEEFNKCAAMRKEFIRAQSLENTAKDKLYKRLEK